MQGRHHRSSLAAGRISPEGSLRGHTHGGFYNSEYRNFNRSFGRSGPPPPPPPPPKPRRIGGGGGGDVFMEAGRLAAEYLVSQGVLSPNMLQGKLQQQNGSPKEFRLQDREDAKNSALSRLGNVVPEGRRRFSDDFNTTSRNHMRGKTRMESFESGSRENGRSNYWWSDKPKTFYDREVEDHHELSGGGIDGSSETWAELPSKFDLAVNFQAQLDNYEVPDEAGSNATDAGVPLEIDQQLSKGSNDMKTEIVKTEELKTCTSNDETKKQGAVEDFSYPQHLSVEDDGVGSNGNDLLQLCNSENVPTEACSLLTIKESKEEPVPITDDRKTCEISPGDGLKVPIEEAPVQDSSNNPSPHQIHDNKSSDTGVSGAPSIQSSEDVPVLDSAYGAERDETTRQDSLPDGCIINEKTSGEGLFELEKCSWVKDRGEKRAAHSYDTEERTKKPREMSSAMLGPDEHCIHHNFNGDLPHSHDKSITPDVDVIEITEEERVLDVDFYPRGVEESTIEFREEKQLFPSSFKICDLNLMEASEVSESRTSDPVLNVSSTLGVKKELPVDVDLTISNSCNASDDYEKCSTNDHGPMVIEVEDDFIEEDKVFDASERQTENVNSSLESFPDNMESTEDLPDTQDGYGLMISELLGADIPSCSSVSVDGLHPEMGLHNGAGILGDDDPIYLSLGEIPISFLGVWEQPNQQYEKPF